MANNQFVGKMSFVVGASTSGLNTTMDSAAQSVQNFGNKTTKVTTQVASDSKRVAKFGNQVQQFGFLVDDAFTGFAARGFSGAIQAAANNATMLAMQFGSIAGITTVLVMGVAQLATKMWKVVDPAKQLTAELKAQKVAHDANIDALNTVFELQQRAMEQREFLGSKPDVEAIDDRLKNLKAKQREERHAMQLHGAELANINEEIAKQVQFEVNRGPEWDWKKVEGAQLGKKKFSRFVKTMLTDEEKEARARVELSKLTNKQNEDFQKSLDKRAQILEEQKATAASLDLLQRQVDVMAEARSKAFDRKLKEDKEKAAKKQAKVDEQAAKDLRAEREILNDEAAKNQKVMMDARQSMLDAGRSVQLVDDKQGGLELGVTANTDEFDAKLQASVNKFRGMIHEADDIPDDAARGLQLHAILAQADAELTQMAEKAGGIKANLGSMRSVGASEAGSSQAFSLVNRAVNSNRQDQQNIAAETRAVAARVAEVKKSIDDIKRQIQTVR